MAQGFLASALRVQCDANLVALEPPAMRMMVITLRRIAQSDGIALHAVSEDVDAGSDRS